MPTYVYAVVKPDGTLCDHFEIVQKMSDPALATHPETGEPIYRITGVRPERWVRQTDFANEEAVGYLADRLARLGVEEQLLAHGAAPGSTVVIGPGDDAVVFDWEPTIGAGGTSASGPRGTDRRLEDW